jgi:hypothetical protein
VSNYGEDPVDQRPHDWTGKDSQSEAVRRSELWNVDHVDETYDPAFLDQLADAVQDTAPP